MHVENTSNKPRHRPGRHPWNRATQWVGRLLCLSLAVSMAGAAVEVFARPAGSWWKYTWFLVPVLLVVWVALRVLEKHRAGLETAAERGWHAEEAQEADWEAEVDSGEQELAGR